MSYQLTDIFSVKDRTISFEVFPAKTPEGHVKLLETIKVLSRLKPDFISCTYGAGGGTRERTLDVVQHIQEVHGIPAMAHLTCVGQSRQEIRKILDDFKRRGIVNILALRGDPPQDDALIAGDFRYASELVGFIRDYLGDGVSIGVAGFPEKHPLSRDMESEIDFLGKKMSAGADFIVTQLFFDNQVYFDYVSRLCRSGINARVIPGILPITDFHGLERFCGKCGATIPDKVRNVFEPLAGVPESVVESGVYYAAEQCRSLCSGRAKGVHLYTLNKHEGIARIMAQLRSR